MYMYPQRSGTILKINALLHLMWFYEPQSSFDAPYIAPLLDFVPMTLLHYYYYDDIIAVEASLISHVHPPTEITHR